MHLQELIINQADEFRDLPFVLQEHETLTYGRFFSLVTNLARSLQEAGITRGDHVVHHLPTSTVSMGVFYATQLLGAVFAPLNYNWPRKACTAIVSQLSPAMYLGDEPLRGARCHMSRARLQGLWDGGNTCPAPVLPSLSGKDSSTILYTSGTTGTAKGTILSHETLFKRACLFADRYGWTPSDVLLSPGEMHTIDRIRNGCIAPLFVGNRVVVDTRRAKFFTHMADLIASHRVTIVSFTPSLVRQFNQYHHDLDRAQLKTLRVVGCPGNRVTDEDRLTFEALYQKRLLPYYGLTETGGFCAGIFPDTPRSFDTYTGLPVACDMKVIDDNGRPVEPGATGELILRSPIPFMQGYVGQPKLTHKTIRGEWLYTQDMASLSAEGALRIFGRRGDVFKNVYEELTYPLEIETVLMRHSAVHECCVFGCPNKLGGTGIAAALTVVEDIEDDALLFRELRQLVTAELGSQKAPSNFSILDTFPKTNHGKIKRHEVKEQCLDDGDPIKETIRDLYDRAASAGDRPFLVTDHERTHSHTLQSIRQLSGVFQGLGLCAGDRIAVLSHDDHEVASLFLASLFNGIVCSVLEEDIKPQRAESILKRYQPKCLFIDADKARRLRTHLDRQIDITHIVHIEQRTTLSRIRNLWPHRRSRGKTVAYGACVRQARPAEPTFAVNTKDQTALILFTSGTTSRPKGVELSYGNLFSHLATLRKVYGFNDRTRCLNIMPLSHVDGLVQGPLLTFYVHGTLYRPFSFSFKRLNEIGLVLRDARMTHMIAAPTMLSLMHQYAEHKMAFFSHPEFQTIISVAAMLEKALYDHMTRDFKVKIINVYGLTETVAGSLFTDPDNAAHAGTIGHPVDCEAKIITENGTPAEQGCVGELLLRGPHVMKGYFDEPGETRKVLTEGWLRTGDLAVKQDAGYVIVGRKKNVIILGGFAVYPEEISDRLNTHAAVGESVTFGRPNDHWGEEVVSAVVLKEGASVTERELKAHCQKELETYKVPRSIYFLEALPRGRSGKIQVEPLKQTLDTLHSSPEASLLDRVKTAASDCFFVPPEDITTQSSPATLKAWDSLGHLDFIARLEQDFSVQLSVRDILRIDTIKEAVAVLEGRG